MSGNKILDLAALVARIPDGAKVAVPSDLAGPPVAAVEELIRQKRRNLHVVAIPTGGLHIDLLIGGGCVGVVECAAVSLGDHGLAPRFRSAVERREIRVRDATCPAVHAGLIAGEKGVPFMAIRGIIGSDLLNYREDWRVVNNPFADGEDPIVLVGAIKPDFALFHAPIADRCGNVWVGTRRELITAAHAARFTLATAERIVDEDLLADPAKAPGVLSHIYVTAIAEAPRGAWPLGLAGCYSPDEARLAAYAGEAVTAEGFARFIAAQMSERPRI
jgi:glutaconate CoA-transferase subunit A